MDLFEDRAMLGAVIAALGAVAGGLIVGLVNLIAQLLVARSEHRRRERIGAVDAATRATMTLDRARPEIIPLFGDETAVQSRIDDLMAHRAGAHGALTRVMVGHYQKKARIAAERCRQTMIVATNDAIAFAAGIHADAGTPIELAVAQRTRQEAEMALTEFVGLLKR